MSESVYQATPVQSLILKNTGGFSKIQALCSTAFRNSFQDFVQNSGHHSLTSDQSFNSHYLSHHQVLQWWSVPELHPLMQWEHVPGRFHRNREQGSAETPLCSGWQPHLSGGERSSLFLSPAGTPRPRNPPATSNRPRACGPACSESGARNYPAETKPSPRSSKTGNVISPYSCPEAKRPYPRPRPAPRDGQGSAGPRSSRELGSGRGAPGCHSHPGAGAGQRAVRRGACWEL